MVTYWQPFFWHATLMHGFTLITCVTSWGMLSIYMKSLTEMTYLQHPLSGSESSGLQLAGHVGMHYLQYFWWVQEIPISGTKKVSHLSVLHSIRFSTRFPAMWRQNLALSLTLQWLAHEGQTDNAALIITSMWGSLLFVVNLDVFLIHWTYCFWDTCIVWQLYTIPCHKHLASHVCSWVLSSE